MKPADAEILDQRSRLAHAEQAFVRIDAREGDEDVVILGDQPRHLFIGIAPLAGRRLAIDGEDHCRDLAVAVILGISPIGLGSYSVLKYLAI